MAKGQGIMEREILKLDLSETSRFNCAPEQVFAASEGHHLLQRHGVRGASEHARLVQIPEGVSPCAEMIYSVGSELRGYAALLYVTHITMRPTHTSLKSS